MVLGAIRNGLRALPACIIQDECTTAIDAARAVPGNCDGCHYEKQPLMQRVDCCVCLIQKTCTFYLYELRFPSMEKIKNGLFIII